MSRHKIECLSPAQRAIIDRFEGVEGGLVCNVPTAKAKCPLHPRRRLLFIVAADGGLMIVPDHHCDEADMLDAANLTVRQLQQAV